MQASPYARFSALAAVVALAGLATAFATGGGSMFSPGDLRATDSTPTRLGGVTSHAELKGKCGACHAGPASSRRMGARCLECHKDIQRDLRDTTTLHGGLVDAKACATCHTEHLGPDGQLTTFAASAKDHDRFGFVLDGAHLKASCRSCHQASGPSGGFAKAPKECIGCHAVKDKHLGKFGRDCASCHNTTTWEGATFAHDVFPVDHGSRGPSECKTCHQDPKDYKQYTCYNCHAHSPARVQAQHREEVGGRNLDKCLTCHAGGRKEGGEGGEHGGGDDH